MIEPFRDVPVRKYRIVNAVPVEDHNAALDRAEAAEARVKELEAEIESLNNILLNANKHADERWMLVEELRAEVARLKALCREAAQLLCDIGVCHEPDCGCPVSTMFKRLRDAEKE